MDLLLFDDIIKSSKNILIMSHINPDGDTLGSMCGLYSVIYDNYKKKPDMLVMSEPPEIYNYLPYISLAKHVEDYDKSREYDLVINVDIASYDRMFESTPLFDKAKYTVNIDHHVTNDLYAKLNYVDENASSTGELLYYLFEDIGLKISDKTAINLYTAILTDTGSFRYSNTTSKALSSASKLVDYGVSPVDIYKKCYETNTKAHVLFQANCINNAIFTDNDRIAYSIVYKKDMEKYNVPEDCTEGLSESLRAIKSVEVSFIVKQLSATLSKISMRSESIDVSKICSSFGGGGHKLAAGCLIKAKPVSAADKVVQEIKKFLV